MHLKLSGNSLYLDHRKVIFWEDRQTIIIADLHIGKTTHFRKSGHSMPSYAFDSDLQRLIQLIQEYKPSRILILGDLYHSDYNNEFEDWHNAITSCSDCEIHLIKGNHDKWSDHTNKFMKEYRLDTVLFESKFRFSHEPEDDEQHVNICGHIHPGVKLQGLGHQRMNLSCFWLSENRLILPAFSELTGKGIVKPMYSDRIFVTTDSEVIEIENKHGG